MKGGCGGRTCPLDFGTAGGAEGWLQQLAGGCVHGLERRGGRDPRAVDE